MPSGSGSHMLTVISITNIIIKFLNIRGIQDMFNRSHVGRVAVNFNQNLIDFYGTGGVFQAMDTEVTQIYK